MSAPGEYLYEFQREIVACENKPNVRPVLPSTKAKQT
jgi:hypothetical protein